MREGCVFEWSQMYASTSRMSANPAAPPELSQSDGGEQRLRDPVEPIGPLQRRPVDVARSRRCAHAAQSGPFAAQNDRHGLIGRPQKPRLARNGLHDQQLGLGLEQHVAAGQETEGPRAGNRSNADGNVRQHRS